MARESSPICFRLSAQDKRLVEIVAQHLNMSVSEYIRTCVLDVATSIIERDGSEAVRSELEKKAAEEFDRKKSQIGALESAVSHLLDDSHRKVW